MTMASSHTSPQRVVHTRLLMRINPATRVPTMPREAPMSVNNDDRVDAIVVSEREFVLNRTAYLRRRRSIHHNSKTGMPSQACYEHWRCQRRKLEPL